MHRSAPVLAVLVAASLALAACSSSTTAKPAPETSTSVAAEAITIDDFAGKNAKEASAALKDAGFLTEYDAGDQTVIMASNWTVDSTTPAAGESAAKGSTVVLHVSKVDGSSSSAPTATDAERSASLDAAIREALGVSEYSQLLAQDASLWGGYVNGVRVEGSNAYVTLQVGAADPSRKDLGSRAASALSTLLPSSAVDGISWIIVEDASGVVIDQKQPKPLN